MDQVFDIFWLKKKQHKITFSFSLFPAKNKIIAIGIKCTLSKFSSSLKVERNKLECFTLEILDCLMFTSDALGDKVGSRFKVLH